MSNIQQEAPLEQDSSKKDFTEKFGDERSDWSNSVTSIGKRFREVENLAEVQVDLYSRRQEALEYQYKLISVHTKMKNMHAAQWKRAMEEAARNEDMRFNDKERAKIADAAVAGLKFKMESVQNQVEFFRETIKTIDNMIFGVKHRIDIENFKVGAK